LLIAGRPIEYLALLIASRPIEYLALLIAGRPIEYLALLIASRPIEYLALLIAGRPIEYLALLPASPGVVLNPATLGSSPRARLATNHERQSLVMLDLEEQVGTAYVGNCREPNPTHNPDGYQLRPSAVWSLERGAATPLAVEAVIRTDRTLPLLWKV